MLIFKDIIDYLNFNETKGYIDYYEFTIIHNEEFYLINMKDDNGYYDSYFMNSNEPLTYDNTILSRLVEAVKKDMRSKKINEFLS